MQKQLAKYIRMLFDKVAADLKAKEAEANIEFIKANTDIWTTTELSNDELQKIDPYGFYTEAERKKYKLPEGKLFDEDNTETEG